jgi:hypothetical protein
MPTLTLRSIIIATALTLIVATCAACEPPWPTGTTVVATTSRPGMPSAAWATAIDDALATWQEELGSDCPIGIARVAPEQADETTRSIELVWPDDWTHGYNEIGEWYYDGGIEVYGTTPDDMRDYTFGSLVHELGHALAGPDHSGGDDIMSADGGKDITFSAETIERVRAARGCGGAQ